MRAGPRCQKKPDPQLLRRRWQPLPWQSSIGDIDQIQQRRAVALEHNTVAQHGQGTSDLKRTLLMEGIDEQIRFVTDNLEFHAR